MSVLLRVSSNRSKMESTGNWASPSISSTAGKSGIVFITPAGPQVITAAQTRLVTKTSTRVPAAT